MADAVTLKAEITGRTGGNGLSGRINWVSGESDGPITREQAEQMQKDGGYHPGGYGLYGFALSRTPDGKYKATWYCSASCD